MSRAKSAIAGVLVGTFAVGSIVVAARSSKEPAPCGNGFSRVGARCCPGLAPEVAPGVCGEEPGGRCPVPLVATDHGCDAPERDVVDVPATTVIVGPSDWEAEGRVDARVAEVGAFAIDRFEVSVGRACAFFSSRNLPAPRGVVCDGRDPARAAGGVAFETARAYCAARGGRLPTEDEWLAAAGGDPPRRYPWGDTGAVCRRAAWGLESGPCAEGGAGPDTVGAHPDGATPLGIHDLAGNVAEWVEVSCTEPARRAPGDLPPSTTGKVCPRVVRGGSWRTRLATELRTWLRREVLVDAERGGDPTIGFRCVYDAAGRP
ncbi:MAG TPA: SUMF1/EgtB/PvdO family nonheme iron enzyme [Labilithrix sp.]|nr:SUMF1/EgtB/PvdO family nonheme iron enzyme [Labilithrix sp.]